MGIIPVSALAISGVRAAQPDQSQESAASAASVGATGPLIASPPVVQNPRPRSFGVSVAVNGLATAWVEYGFSEDDLRFTANASHHGLIQADDQVLHVRGRPAYRSTGFLSSRRSVAEIHQCLSVGTR